MCEAAEGEDPERWHRSDQHSNEQYCIDSSCGSRSEAIEGAPSEQRSRQRNQ
jgi:hypothetical protein